MVKGESVILENVYISERKNIKEMSREEMSREEMSREDIIEDRIKERSEERGER